MLYSKVDVQALRHSKRVAVAALCSLSAQCVSSNGQIIKSVSVSVSVSVSQSVNFGNFSIYQERLKLETSNLAYRFATGGLNEKNAKLGQKGREGVT